MQAHTVEENENLKMALKGRGQKMNLLEQIFWSDRLAIFFVTSPTVSSALETDDVWKRRLREKSEKKES